MKDYVFQGISVSVRAFCSWLIHKIVAVHFGTNALALLAHFQNLLGVFIAPIADGLLKGMIQSYQKSNKYLILFIYFIIILFIGIIYCIFIIFFPKTYTQFFEESPTFIHFLVFFILLIFLLLQQFLLAWAGILQNFLKLSILSAVGIFFSVFLVNISEKLSDLLLLYLFGQSLAFFVGLFILKKDFIDIYNNIKTTKFNTIYFNNIKPILEHLSHFLLVGISIMVFSRLNSYILREYNIWLFGLEKTGLWEAVVKISDNYTVLFHATVSVVFFPKISYLLHQKSFKNYFLKSLFMIALLSAMALLFIFVFRKEITLLFYSPKFLYAQNLFLGVLIGDFFKFQAYLFSHLILASAKIKIYIFLQGLASVVYFGMSVFFIKMYGFWGLQWGFCGSYFCSYVILVVIGFYFFFQKNTSNEENKASKN